MREVTLDAGSATTAGDLAQVTLHCMALVARALSLSRPARSCSASCAPSRLGRVAAPRLLALLSRIGSSRSADEMPMTVTLAPLGCKGPSARSLHRRFLQRSSATTQRFDGTDLARTRQILLDGRQGILIAGLAWNSFRNG